MFSGRDTYTHAHTHGYAPPRTHTHTHTPAHVLVGLEQLLATPQAQQVPLLNIQRHDLLKQLVERCVAVRDDEGALARVVVVEVGDDLHSDIRFPYMGEMGEADERVRR